MIIGVCIQKMNDLTIALVHLVDLKPVLTTWPFQDIVVELVPLCSTSQSGSRNPGKRVEIEPVHDQCYLPYGQQHKASQDGEGDGVHGN